MKAWGGLRRLLRAVRFFLGCTVSVLITKEMDCLGAILDGSERS